MSKLDVYNNIDLKESKYLGRGRNGRVYLLPDGKTVIKICSIERSCISEYEVLKAAEGSPYFPRVYERIGKAMLREFVRGETLPIYLRKNKLSRKLALNLIGLIEEFKRLGFRRMDIRGAHIFVQEDESVKVIDPSSQIARQQRYPKSMLKELRRQRCSNSFYTILKQERPDLYKQWKR